MLDRGVRVTVNSDDPAYFPGYMNENLIAVQEAAGLTKDELIQLARNAFAISWLPRPPSVDTWAAWRATRPDPPADVGCQLRAAPVGPKIAPARRRCCGS